MNTFKANWKNHVNRMPLNRLLGIPYIKKIRQKEEEIQEKPMKRIYVQ